MCSYSEVYIGSHHHENLRFVFHIFPPESWLESQETTAKKKFQKNYTAIQWQYTFIISYPPSFLFVKTCETETDGDEDGEGGAAEIEGHEGETTRADEAGGQDEDG